jgi:hypothetical protein
MHTGWPIRSARSRCRSRIVQPAISGIRDLLGEVAFAEVIVDAVSVTHDALID